MKKLFTGLFFLGFAIVSSAQDINNYKYVIIPETYEFTGEVDEYRLNSLTKFLFEKNGYNTLMKTENKPEDLQNNNCLGLRTKIENNSGLFVTKLVVKLLDCNERVIFQSKEGRSREKDYQAAFQEALRDAFSSLEEIDYVYRQGDISEKASEKRRIAAPIAEKSVTVEKKNEEVVETEIDENFEDEEEVKEEKEVDEINKSDKEYQYSGKTYFLKKTSQGLGLFQENSSDPIAILIETNTGESYIYNSLTNQGIAYFDENGDLFVEYLNRQNNKKVTLTYKLKN